MKLKNIPILCALPRIATSLGDLFTAEPPAPKEKSPELLEAEKMLQIQARLMEAFAAEISAKESQLKAQASKTSLEIQLPDEIISKIGQDIVEQENEEIHMEWVTATPERIPATTDGEIDAKLNKLVEDEERMHAQPDIPHQTPVEQRNGLIPDGRSIDEKLKEAESMRINKTPGSSQKVKKRRTRTKSLHIKAKDTTRVTKEMYDHVMAAFPKFQQMKADSPEITMNRDVFCRQMNRELGTNKTVSVWSNMWMGHTKRDSLPNAADLPKIEEE